MDGIAAIRSYIDRLVTGDGKCGGMKVLLLDAITTQIISCVYSQTEILQKEVYLVTRLDDVKSNPLLKTEKKKKSNEAESSKTSHLKAICFLRPTEGNAGLLVRELSTKFPRYSEYHLFFTGIVPSAILRLLSENDEYEHVKQIQEFYCDFLPVNEDVLSLNCRNTISMTMSAGTAWASDHAPLYTRNREGLSAMLLALKRQPSIIRYQKSSLLSKQLAHDIVENISADQIFHFRNRTNRDFLLLILDRCDDPITPLLSQWTYQAMVHELLGLNNNRVILRGAPGIHADLEEVVLNSGQDEFFHKNKHANFGELGEAIKKLLDDYQKQTQSHSNIKANLNSIEDMQAFMEKFPEIRSQSYNVSKHVAIMGELARLVEVCSLLDISQFEQELACADDYATHTTELMEKLASPTVKVPDKLRLGLLYCIRYEALQGNISRVKTAMLDGGVTPDMVDLVDIIMRYAGKKVRGPGLFGSHDVISKMTKNFMSSVQGVSNVYAQHVPLLMDTIYTLAKNRLKENTHPYVTTGVANHLAYDGNSLHNKPPQEILIFMIGGITYEEATKVHEFNQTNSYAIKIMLAGSTIHNSTSFLDELKAL